MCIRDSHHRLQHSCLYDKHLFVPRTAPTTASYQEADVRFIDLEKLRQGISRERVAAHDVDQLMRHTQGWSESDRATFRSAYRDQRSALKR